jgi:hypothetical protein
MAIEHAKERGGIQEIDYQRIATWEDDEVAVYESLKQRALSVDKSIPEFVKEIIERETNRDEN